jgi:hypothetical protein
MYLYAIEDQQLGLCKLGYSQDPHRRCAELQVGNPHPLRVVHAVRVDLDRARVLEAQLHLQLNHLRERGEWFRVDSVRARGMLDYCVIRWHDDGLLE